MKALCMTTDILDDLLRAGRNYDRRDLDALMKYSASLGAKRFEWILDTLWTLYEDDSPVGFDLLKEACEAAHRHGMRFDVVYKPFEGAFGDHGAVLPCTFPRPVGIPVLEDLAGLIPLVRPFVAEHPEMRLARRSEDDVDPGGRIASIRLVKNNDAPSDLSLDDLSVLISQRNGGFQQYEGPVSLSESLGWRGRFYSRLGQQYRIVTLSDLEIPESMRCVVIRCRKRERTNGGFTNQIEALVELVNEQGQIIPSTPTSGKIDAEALFGRANQFARLGINPYFKHPDVLEWLQNRDKFLSECRDVYNFSCWWMWQQDVTLTEVSEIAVMRGKPRHVFGALHPVYPEVRQCWLDQIQYCIDRNVDGVNIRVAAHNRPYEPCKYGFNEPVLEQLAHRDNIAEARRVNGDAYMKFMRDASDLLHGQGKEMGVHVHGLVLRHRDGDPDVTVLPHHFDWQWETWIKELADYVEFRGSFALRPANVREVVDRIGLAAREAGIPFIYQCHLGRIGFDGPYPELSGEMELARNHPDITHFNLYETASFSRVNSEDQLEGSPDVAKLIQESWTR